MMRSASISLKGSKGQRFSKVQKHLQLHDLSTGECITDRYALWLDLRTIHESTLHEMGRGIGSAGGGIYSTDLEESKIRWSAQDLIINAQLNIQN